MVFNWIYKYWVGAGTVQTVRFCGLKIVENTGEARQLLEAGFEYVCTTPEETRLFRKRK